MSLKKAYLLIISILLIDQISKIYIKTNFFINDPPSILPLSYGKRAYRNEFIPKRLNFTPERSN